jgi:hypothetical protein
MSNAWSIVDIQYHCGQDEVAFRYNKFKGVDYWICYRCVFPAPAPFRRLRHTGHAPWTLSGRISRHSARSRSQPCLHPWETNGRGDTCARVIHRNDRPARNRRSLSFRVPLYLTAATSAPEPGWPLSRGVPNGACPGHMPNMWQVPRRLSREPAAAAAAAAADGLTDRAAGVVLLRYRQGEE